MYGMKADLVRLPISAYEHLNPEEEHKEEHGGRVAERGGVSQQSRKAAVCTGRVIGGRSQQ